MSVIYTDANLTFFNMTSKKQNVQSIVFAKQNSFNHISTVFLCGPGLCVVIETLWGMGFLASYSEW